MHSAAELLGPEGPFARDVPAFHKPIIYLTAHGVRYTDAQLMQTGADRVVTKPVDFSALGALIDELMRTKGSG